MRNVSPLLIFAAFLSLAGCATIFTGNQDTITITATPESSSISKDGRFLGTGTATFVAQRTAFGEKPKIRVEAQGYETQEFPLETKFNAAAIGNLTFVFSWTTDVVAGSVVKYSPDNYHVTLRQKTAKIDDRSMYVDLFALMSWSHVTSELAARNTETVQLLAAMAFPDDDKLQSALVEELWVRSIALISADTPIAFLDEIRASIRTTRERLHHAG